MDFCKLGRYAFFVMFYLLSLAVVATQLFVMVSHLTIILSCVKAITIALAVVGRHFYSKKKMIVAGRHLFKLDF